MQLCNTMLMYSDDEIDREVLRAGAAGYVLQMMKRGAKAEVRVRAARACVGVMFVLLGQVVVSAAAAKHLNIGLKLCMSS